MTEPPTTQRARVVAAGRSLLEATGLDWLPYAFSKRSPHAPGPAEANLEELCGTIATKTDDDIETIIANTKEFLTEATDRVAKIEAKGTALFGFTGTMLALTVTITSNLLDPRQTTSTTLLVCARLSYVLASCSLVMVIMILLKLLDVFAYRHARPAAADLLQGNPGTRSWKNEYAAGLYFAQERSARIAAEKGTYLGGAQLWFRNAILCLFILGCLLAAVQRAAVREATSPRTQPALAQSMPRPTRTVTSAYPTAAATVATAAVPNGALTTAPPTLPSTTTKAVPAPSPSPATPPTADRTPARTPSSPANPRP